MAVWGIGAYYKGSNSSDKTAEFLIILHTPSSAVGQHNIYHIQPE